MITLPSKVLLAISARSVAERFLAGGKGRHNARRLELSFWAHRPIRLSGTIFETLAARMVDLVGEKLGMNGKVFAAALLSAMLSIASAEARGPYGSINVGKWSGGAYTTD